jgi:hypothetical protein
VLVEECVHGEEGVGTTVKAYWVRKKEYWLREGGLEILGAWVAGSYAGQLFLGAPWGYVVGVALALLVRGVIRVCVRRK